MGSPEILDVAYVIFDWEEDAEYWMAQCADWDRFNTISRLRTFLAADCLTQYQVHSMNDRQVMRTAARELCMNVHRMVIKPKIGWALWVDPQTRKPVQPIAVEGAPDLDGLLEPWYQTLNCGSNLALVRCCEGCEALTGKA